MNKSIIVALAIAAIALGMIASTTVLTTGIAFANPKYADGTDHDNGGGNDHGKKLCTEGKKC
jgi:hypothetical protein